MNRRSKDFALSSTEVTRGEPRVVDGNNRRNETGPIWGVVHHELCLTGQQVGNPNGTPDSDTQFVRIPKFLGDLEAVGR